MSRILSGMRTTGRLHLGHYHGVLKNWLKLQHEYECFFFAADLHALTTHYENATEIQQHTWDMIVDWLAVGVSPSSATIFIQSMVPEHAELNLYLSMITPLGWLERVPTYKDQIEKLKERDLGTYGFLGYPVLQSADILVYKASLVPVGEDQVPHLEITREIARRFNNFYGKEPGYQEKAELAINKLGKKGAEQYRALLRAYQEKGEQDALAAGQSILAEQANLRLDEQELLLGYLEGGGKIILPEPMPLLTPESKFPGLDGEKMSKSYNNTIQLRESDENIAAKIQKMPTDPARVRRSDPGTPEKCPVWALHKVYSTDEVKNWVQTGCRSAGIGCVECKRPVIESIQKEVAPIRERAEELEQNPGLVRKTVLEGAEYAREVAGETLEDVRRAIGLDYQ